MDIINDQKDKRTGHYPVPAGSELNNRLMDLLPVQVLRVIEKFTVKLGKCLYPADSYINCFMAHPVSFNKECRKANQKRKDKSDSNKTIDKCSSYEGMKGVLAAHVNLSLLDNR